MTYQIQGRRSGSPVCTFRTYAGSLASCCCSVPRTPPYFDMAQIYCGAYLKVEASPRLTCLVLRRRVGELDASVSKRTLGAAYGVVRIAITAACCTVLLLLLLLLLLAAICLPALLRKRQYFLLPHVLLLVPPRLDVAFDFDSTISLTTLEPSLLRTCYRQSLIPWFVIVQSC